MVTSKDKRYLRQMSSWLLLASVRVWLNHLATRKDIEPLALLLLEELFERARRLNEERFPTGNLPSVESGGEGGKAEAE